MLDFMGSWPGVVVRDQTCDIFTLEGESAGALSFPAKECAVKKL
jgi:hypothetical protein